MSARNKYDGVLNEFFKEDEPPKKEPKKPPTKKAEKKPKKPKKKAAKKPKKVENKKDEVFDEAELLKKLALLVDPNTVEQLVNDKVKESMDSISTKAAILLLIDEHQAEKPTTNEKEVNSFLDDTVVQPKSRRRRTPKNVPKEKEPEDLDPPTQRPARKASKTPTFTKSIVTDIPPVKYMTAEDVPKGEVWTVYGNKGSGKTSFAMSFPGTMVVIQFDETSSIIWREQFNCDPRIKIVDVTNLADFDDPLSFLESSNRIMGYVSDVMKDIKKNGGVDRVILDNVEVYMEYAENAMRYYHNLKMSEGFKNLALWKTRGMFFKQLHSKSFAIAKKGIIYTTYPYIEETITRFGKQEKTKKPRWKDAIEKNTQNLVEVFYEESDSENKYFIYTESMKRGYKNGKTIDITTPGDQPPRGWDILQEHKK